MLNEFKSWFEKNIPDWQNQRYLLGVSGGIDSIVLTDLFYQLRVDFEIAHCNFKLRGKESDQDESFVRQLAEKNRVSFHCQRFETSEYAKQHKVNIQEAARNLRYNWFEELRKKHRIQYLAVGTHKSDETETILINLMRGSGIRGTHGILPVKETVIRPLLGFGQESISTYAKNNKLKWREDSSNSSTKYLRNKLRLEIIPKLKEINPNLEQRITQNAEQVREAEQLLDEKLKRMTPIVINKHGDHWKINKFLLLQLNQAHLYLNEILKPFGFSMNETKQVIASLNNQPGGVVSSLEFDLLNDRHFLVITSKSLVPPKPVQLEQSTIKTEVPSLSISTFDPKLLLPYTGQNIASLDADKLSFPLEMRPWKPGDKFQPLGMSGKKKVSDLLIDLKIPKTLKKHVLVVTSGTEIAWVVNLRLDDRFKVTDKTKQVYQIVYHPK